MVSDGIGDPRGQIGIGVKKGNAALQQSLNAAIDQLRRAAIKAETQIEVGDIGFRNQHRGAEGDLRRPFLGAGLDFFFAHRFFQFPNRNAVLGISAPAAGGPIPIEEYFFYFAGFLAVLLFYVWLDGYWLHAYSVPDHDLRRSSFRRLLGFHPDSLVLAVFLISAAIVYKNIASTRTAGFPGYATFLILGPLMPSAALFPVARTVINWRALSLTLFIILLLSLQWEATLAVPYGWWIYQDTEMVGIHIRAWDNLPIEAVFVWGAVTYTTVIVYEVVRCWQASGKSATHAFLGKGPANHAADAN